MKLNLWVRIGILLSVMWAVGAAVYTHNDDLKTADFWEKLDYSTCSTTKQQNHDSDMSSCDAKRTEIHKTWMAGDNASMVFVALAPLPLAWFAVFVLVYVGRALIAGFPIVVPWRALSRAKKLFIGFCCALCAFFALIGFTWILNVYVDRKVPVGISSFQDFTNRDGYVMVTGTWTRTDLTDDTIADPLQTSKIECDKTTNKCTEAKAYVTGTTLLTDLVSYDIQSWTPDAVVIRNDDLCATEIFTIDLNTKAVTGAGHSTHESDAYCASNHNDKKTWSFQLSNGFKTYWELRQKARPMPLRVIYSLFGN